MGEERNTLAWPSIEQYPREVASRINRFFAVAEAAATTIQRAHRGDSWSPQNFRGGYRSRLRKWLLSEPVTSGTKFDGTNVGVMRDGTLLGRRLVIEASATSYQRTDLKALRSYETAKAIEELVAIGGATPVSRVALYGELLCNELYSYKADGISKGWLAFGALLDFDGESAAVEYARAAGAAGLDCHVSDATVRVCNGAAFTAILQRHGVPVVATTRHESLCAAIATCREWMVGEHGEGLVLSVASRTGRTSTYKWKISREPQPAATEALTELVASLRDGAGGKAALLDPAIHACVVCLLEVATHVDSTTLAATVTRGGESGGKVAKPPKPVVVDAGAVERALNSALTKFDAIGTYLDVHGQAGVPRLVKHLTSEMLADTELAECLPAEDDSKAREAAVRAVGTVVKKHVGQQLGAWKKTGGAAAIGAG